MSKPTTFGTAPFSVRLDERFDDDDGQDRAFFVVVLVWCDDHGRFEGDIEGFSRDTSLPAAHVEARFASLERRAVVARYQAPGRRRLVGEILDFDRLPGHPPRRAHPSKRGEGRFPDRKGQIPGPRRKRVGPVSVVTPPFIDTRGIGERR